MRAKSLLAFAMAIGCGLVAMVGVQQVMKKQTADPDANNVTVYVAATEIPPGQVLDVTMLEKKKFLKGSVPKEAVTDPAQLERRALIVKCMPGDIIRLDKLGEEGKTGASISIPKGMRLFTVPANQTLSHSGMLKPDDRVDVMVTYKVHQDRRLGGDYSETKTFLSYIQVFATDSVRDPNAGADPSGKASILKNITLLVTPDQAQTLGMAKSIGELTLNLRNASDTESLELSSLTPDQFRKQILQTSVPPEEEHKKPASEATVETEDPVAAFADEAMGNQKQVASAGTRAVAVQAPLPEATTEAWDITIFSKAGPKVETVEVDRRKETPKPTEVKYVDSDAKKAINSLIDMFQAPKKEVVTLKPVHVGRPIYPDPANGPALASVQTRPGKGALIQPAKAATTNDTAKPTKPVTTKPVATKPEATKPVTKKPAATEKTP